MGAWRLRHNVSLRQLAWGLGAAAAFGVPVITWILVARGAGHAAYGQAALVSQSTGGSGSSGVPAAAPPSYNLRYFASYLWQFYLPKLPSMAENRFVFPIISHYPAYEVWLSSGWASFGWVNVWFPVWVYRVFLAVVVVVGAGAAFTAGRAIAAMRAAGGVVRRAPWPMIGFFGLTHDWEQPVNEGVLRSSRAVTCCPSARCSRSSWRRRCGRCRRASGRSRSGPCSAGSSRSSWSVWPWWPRGTMPSRRAAAIGISAMLLAGLLVLAVTGAGKRTDLVQSDAVNPIYPVAPVAPGSIVCQKPFGLTETLDRVRFNAGTFGRPGPPLVVSVTSEQSGAELGWGRQPRGWVDNGTPRISDVGDVKPGEQVDVCIRNEGRTPAYLYGDFYHGRFSKGPLGVTPSPREPTVFPVAVSTRVRTPSEQSVALGQSAA